MSKIKYSDFEIYTIYRVKQSWRTHFGFTKDPISDDEFFRDLFIQFDTELRNNVTWNYAGRALAAATEGGLLGGVLGGLY